MDNFDAHPDESIKQFINKYPLTVPFFQERKLSEKNMEMSLDDFCRQNDLSWNELDSKLQQHLARAVVPDSESCYSICLSEFLCGKTLAAAALVVFVVLIIGLFLWLL